MSHSLAWRDFLPTPHWSSHGHVLQTAPSSLAHLSHTWPHLNDFDTSITTISCQTYINVDYIAFKNYSRCYSSKQESKECVWHYKGCIVQLTHQ